MEYGFFPYLAELLAGRGFVVVRFNFSSAGMAPGDERVTDTEAFRHGLITDDRAELLEVLAAVAGGRLAAGRVDPDRLGLMGHSRGGGAALLAAAHPETKTQLFSDDGGLNRYVNVYLNDEDVRFLDGINTKVADGDNVTILPAVAGGMA